MEEFPRRDESIFDQEKILLQKIQEARSYIIQFKFLKTIEDVKEAVIDADLSTLEARTGESAETLDGVIPHITEDYNTLVHDLLNPDLTYERFQEIMKEGANLTR
ncbi:MAG TPA: hypothetical protein VL576_00895 [Candidatus Paceibacterota bacterium]|jgi:hypothetical protein|nr:hypothetical protein [Candidatus Paceibacterota bacterium]